MTKMYVDVRDYHGASVDWTGYSAKDWPSYYRIKIDGEYIKWFPSWYMSKSGSKVEYTHYKTEALRVRDKDLDDFLLLLESHGYKMECFTIEPTSYVSVLAQIWET